MVALGEHDLLEVALFEPVEEAVEFAHRFADGGEFGVCNSDATRWFAHRSRDDRGSFGRIGDGGVGVLSALSATLRLG